MKPKLSSHGYKDKIWMRMHLQSFRCCFWFKALMKLYSTMTSSSRVFVAPLLMRVVSKSAFDGVIGTTHNERGTPVVTCMKCLPNELREAPKIITVSRQVVLPKGLHSLYSLGSRKGYKLLWVCNGLLYGTQLTLVQCYWEFTGDVSDKLLSPTILHTKEKYYNILCIVFWCWS